MDATNRDVVSKAIGQYISENFLDGSDVSELAPDTPLVEWGVLSSMNTSLLLAYIQSDLGVAVPPTHLTARNFADLDAITDLVHTLATEAA
ncbi:acyl carrier protein [Streptomyces armeniacus]|uniref:Acyl carrier protein n=1 Tax=Streptomyces armeniacus TaxID=83291 RepID=A0A345XJL3_9ACTN|nr:phosphopantetheine-binding protein [Streptomyces armeniacus]AXK31829.1 acyl carrier protein [Streptomyces armeniacus]